MAIIKFGGKPITGYNILIIAFATFGSITYGYCSAIIGSTLGQPSFLSYFGLDTAKNAPALIGAINGLFQGGGLLGTLAFGFFADKFGRCKTMFVASLLAIIGGGLQAGSVHLAMYLVARFMTGFAIGGLVMIVPLWQSEVAPPHARGLLVGLHGVSILLGYSSSAWVGFGFYFVSVDGAQWRPPLALQCVPPLILACGVYFIPESPRWLVEHDQHERAELILKRIYKDSKDPGHHEATNEFRQIQAQIELERHLPSSWSSIFKVPHYRKRAFIGFTTLLAGQLTGTTVINNYGPSLYASLGHGTSASLALSAGWLTEGLVCNAINALLLDYVGRKWLMVTGLVGCAVSLLGVSIMVALYGGTTNTGGNSAGVFFLYLHLTFYATCMDASTYVYGSEIWPTHLRGKGFAISCAGLFVGSLTLLEAAPTAFETIGWRFYLIMMAFTIVCAVIFALFFPETKGLTLEEISRLFGDEVAPGVAHDEVTPSITSEGEKVKTSTHSVA
ncbi:general substrate transporter [Sarocladium strictum]